MMVWFDRLMLAGLVALVVFSPMAIGSVNPWAFCTVEVIIFFLTIVWMARLAMDGAPQAFGGLRKLLIPAGMFVGLILFQLLPLPPALERVISPSTYRLYATSLPGWPTRDPYPDATAAVPDRETGRTPILDAMAPVGRGPLAKQMRQVPVRWPMADSFAAISRWRPISIAPGLTGTSLLKVIAYACLFFLVLFYPLRSYPQPGGERRFFRRLLMVILITGLTIACIGLLERALWNGAILWFYVPYDWGQPRPDLDPRAVGPFVNPNHFAAYLNLILPLALVGALFRTFLCRRSASQEPLRFFCLVAASVLICAIALSLSRGGWLGALIAASMVIGLALAALWRGRPGRRESRLEVPGAFYVISVLCIVVITTVYTAPSLPTAVDARLEATMSEPDFSSRLGYWRDSMTMIRDFPALGVGLGSFQDLFARYQSPPWAPYSVREAHNDYVELAAEAGVVGLGLALWFFLVASVRIYRGLRTVHPEALPVVAALIAGLAAIAVQEVFEFALQIPGNAVLFTILLAATLRLCGAARGEGYEKSHVASRVRLFAGVTALAAMAMIALVLRQDRVPYPYLPALPHDVRAAQALIMEHPGRSTPHLWYAAMEHGSSAVQLRELAIAASLEPINPLILDRYAQALAVSGRTGSALAELTRSVFVYPQMGDHFYLEPDLIPWLSIEERKAIDAGFKAAVARRFDGASPAFAAFCAALNHDAAEADVLAQASSSADQPARRADLLVEAGDAYAQAGDMARAQAAFEQATRVEPSNAKAYQALATEIFAPRKDLGSAQAAIQRGLNNGADPFALYLSLAQVCEQAGDISGAESALLKAGNARPNGSLDYDTLMRLADLERRANRFEKALLWTRKAIAIRPGSPDALYQLALDEEADYDYGAALRDLAQGIKLAPDNAGMRGHYQDLLRMIADYSDHNHR
jgi:O-antigen ligase/tetratricopeptide (TPR) repeat protein